MAQLCGHLAFLAVLVCLACGQTCPDGGWFYDCLNKKCLKVVNTARKWADARTTCQEDGGDLVEFQTEDDLPTFIKFPDIFPSNQHFWIGLNDRAVEGVWKWNNRKENATYFNWSRNHPIAARSGGPLDCVSVVKQRETVLWFNLRCHQGFKFICQRLTNEDMEVYRARHVNELSVNCPEDYIRVPNRRKCIKLVNTAAMYSEAMNKCHSEIPGKTNLVDIPDFEVKDFLQTKAGRGMYWIAATDQGTEGTFTTSTLPGAKPVTYLPWKSGTAMHEQHDCVLLQPGSSGTESVYWNVPCTYRKPYICQYDPPPALPTEKTCPDGWRRFAASETCFRVMDQQKKMWRKAREDCQENMEGDLATIPDRRTQNFLKDIVSASRYWIGLVDRGQNGTFFWLGQETPIEFEAWAKPPTNPSGEEFCVEMIGKNRGKWNDKACTVKRHFICEKAATLPTHE